MTEEKTTWWDSFVKKLCNSTRNKTPEQVPLSDDYGYGYEA